MRFWKKLRKTVFNSIKEFPGVVLLQQLNPVNLMPFTNNLYVLHLISFCIFYSFVFFKDFFVL